MLVDFKIWEKLFLEIGKIINAHIEIKRNPSLGLNTEFITGKLSFSYYNGSLKIVQGANKVDYKNCSPSYLRLEYLFDNFNDLHIILSNKDFFDMFFSGNRINSGNKTFDKKFTIKSSNRRLALKLFKEARVQKLFLGHPFLIFNIINEQGKTTITLKSMIKKLYSKEEMLFYLEEFKFIVSKITYSLG